MSCRVASHWAEMVNQDKFEAVGDSVAMVCGPPSFAVVADGAIWALCATLGAATSYAKRLRRHQEIDIAGVEVWLTDAQREMV